MTINLTNYSGGNTYGAPDVSSYGSLGRNKTNYNLQYAQASFGNTGTIFFQTLRVLPLTIKVYNMCMCV